MADAIKPVRLLGGENLRSAISAVGPIPIGTPRGQIDADEVPGFSTLLFERDEGRSVAVLVYCPTHGRGYFTQMSAENARKAGASLLHLANFIDDGGEVN